MNRIILAIDPGLSGALAVYAGGPTVIVQDLPTVQHNKKTRLDLDALASSIAVLASDYYLKHAIVEGVSSMPSQGIASAFNFGFTTGAIHGILAANGLTIHRVSPQTWKFNVGLNADKDANTRMRKNASRARAIKLFPESADLFARVKDDGRAEAALMAWYGLNKLDLA